MRSVAALILLELLAGCASPRRIVEKTTPYSASNAEGVWVGLAQGGLEMYRIKLDTVSETGMLFHDYAPSGELEKYAIMKWSVAPPNGLRIVSAGGAVERIEGGFITPQMFIATVFGVQGWTNEVSFYKETDLLERIRRFEESEK